MKFTYTSYKKLIKALRDGGYSVTDYHDWKSLDRCVILRHDIDYDLSAAVTLGEVEREQGVKSTWFVLLTSDFYNVFSKSSSDSLKRLLDMGHTIGLHFDEARYNMTGEKEEDIISLIQNEADILSRAIGQKVDVVSMHRPSRQTLEADIQIPGIVNSYSQLFFKEFKYLSDSRRHWREPVMDIVRAAANCEGWGNKRLHILIHAFWYHEEEEDINATLQRFINKGNRDRYLTMMENITDLPSIMPETEIS